MTGKISLSDLSSYVSNPSLSHGISRSKICWERTPNGDWVAYIIEEPFIYQYWRGPSLTPPQPPPPPQPKPTKPPHDERGPNHCNHGFHRPCEECEPALFTQWKALLGGPR